MNRMMAALLGAASLVGLCLPATVGANPMPRAALTVSSISPSTFSRCGGTVLTAIGTGMAAVEKAAVSVGTFDISYARILSKTSTKVRFVSPRRSSGGNLIAWVSIGATVAYKPVTVTDPGVCPATQPRQLTATAADHAVRLTWTAPADNGGERIVAYRVQRVSGTGKWQTVTSEAPLTGRYTVSSLTNGVDYRFRVAAISRSEVLGAWATVSATPHR